MKKNIIIAKGVKGIYKDKEIEIKIGNHSDNSDIKVNGKKVRGIFGVHIHIRVDKETTLILEKYKDLE